MKLIVLDVKPVPEEFPVENEMLFKSIGLIIIEPDLALQSISVVMKM